MKNKKIIGSNTVASNPDAVVVIERVETVKEFQELQVGSIVKLKKRYRYMAESIKTLYSQDFIVVHYTESGSNAGTYLINGLNFSMSFHVAPHTLHFVRMATVKEALELKR